KRGCGLRRGALVARAASVAGEAGDAARRRGGDVCAAGAGGKRWLMRARAIAAYSSLSSTPMKRNSSPTAPQPVEPDPANGSRTTPPRGVTNRQSQAIRATGLAVG